ncbi:MAG: hypothetical protein ACI86H_002385 [bacterium]|jgi:hypothetical protein
MNSKSIYTVLLKKCDYCSLSLEGEGWGEGGTQNLSPHLNPLPQGEETKNFRKLQIYFP